MENPAPNWSTTLSLDANAWAHSPKTLTMWQGDTASILAIASPRTGQENSLVQRGSRVPLPVRRKGQWHCSWILFLDDAYATKLNKGHAEEAAETSKSWDLDEGLGIALVFAYAVPRQECFRPTSFKHTVSKVK